MTWLEVPATTPACESGERGLGVPFWCVHTGVRYEKPEISMLTTGVPHMKTSIVQSFF